MVILQNIALYDHIGPCDYNNAAAGSVEGDQGREVINIMDTSTITTSPMLLTEHQDNDLNEHFNPSDDVVT